MAEHSTALQTQIQTGIFISGVGISAIGDFIYLVAINVLVLDRTHSASAVAGLWVVTRIAALAIGPWVGSITDRLSRRKQLIIVELARAVLIGTLPVLSHLASIYAILFFLGVGSTFFGSLFLPYQTLLIPETSRKRVNSIISTLRYSAFLTGPAIAGALLIHGNASIPLWLDSISFLVSAVSFTLLPDLGAPQVSTERKHPWRTVLTDWRTAFDFLSDNRLFTILFSLNAIIGVFALTVVVDPRQTNRYDVAFRCRNNAERLWISALCVGTFLLVGCDWPHYLGTVRIKCKRRFYNLHATSDASIAHGSNSKRDRTASATVQYRLHLGWRTCRNLAGCT